MSIEHINHQNSAICIAECPRQSWFPHFLCSWKAASKLSLGQGFVSHVHVQCKLSFHCFVTLASQTHCTCPFNLNITKKKRHKPLAAVVKLHQDHCVSLSSGLFGLTLMLQKINLLISNSFSTDPITLNTLNLTPCYSGLRYYDYITFRLKLSEIDLVRNRSSHISAGNPAWVFFRFL